MNPISADPAFHYFPDNYRWSMGLLLCLSAAPWGGAEIDEVHRVGQKLQGHIGDDQVWFEEWAHMAGQLEQQGRLAQERGHEQTAASCLFRSAHYYQTGERFLHPKTEIAFAGYRKSVDAFRDACGMISWPRIESVEVPYKDKSLPALFVHGGIDKDPHQRPAMVFFDGFDVTKEIQYFKAIPDLARRGISCLIVDGPGNGESIRFRDMPLIAETEDYGTAALDYLLQRDDVDPDRIGVMAISLGGYYAPRAAALEQRFACCIAWGAQWDYYKTWADRFDRLDRGELPSLSVPPEHLQWILGVDSRAEAMEKLGAFRLDGIVQKMNCPFLLVHGEGDRQISTEVAQTCFDSVGSSEKVLKIFKREEGGFHHCQIDNITLGSSFMWDWLVDVLKPGRERN